MQKVVSWLSYNTLEDYFKGTGIVEKHYNSENIKFEKTGMIPMKSGEYKVKYTLWN